MSTHANKTSNSLFQSKPVQSQHRHLSTQHVALYQATTKDETATPMLVLDPTASPTDKLARTTIRTRSCLPKTEIKSLGPQGRTTHFLQSWSLQPADEVQSAILKSPFQELVDQDVSAKVPSGWFLHLHSLTSPRR